MPYILLGPKFPMLSIQIERYDKKKISVFHYMFFFLILFKFAIHSSPLLTCSNISKASAEYKSTFSSVKYDNL